MLPLAEHMQGVGARSCGMSHCGAASTHVAADRQLLVMCRGRRYEGKGRSSRWSRQPLVLCADVALGWDELLDDSPTC